MANNEYLDILRGIAFYIKLVPKKKGVGNAVTIGSLIKVLQNVQASYQNYVDVRFKQSFTLEDFPKGVDKVAGSLKKEFELLVVDLKYESFNAGLAPDYVSVTHLKENLLNWKKEAFNEFKEDVFFADYNSEEFIKKITNKFTKEERRFIYNPIIQSVKRSDDYTITVSNRDFNDPKELKPVTKNLADIIVPPKTIEELPDEEILVKTYLRVIKKGGLLDIKKGNIKEVINVEELSFEVYPYSPTIIDLDDEDIKITLKKPLVCEVEHVDDYFHISNDDLNINVWGESRAEAEEAFNFAFISHYENYVLEDDDQLTEKALILKRLMQSLIKDVEQPESSR